MKILVLGLLCLISLVGLFFSCFPQIFVSEPEFGEAQTFFGFVCICCLIGFGNMLGNSLEVKRTRMPRTKSNRVE